MSTTSPALLGILARAEYIGYSIPNLPLIGWFEKKRIKQADSLLLAPGIDID